MSSISLRNGPEPVDQLLARTHKVGNWGDYQMAHGTGTVTGTGTSGTSARLFNMSTGTTAGSTTLRRGNGGGGGFSRGVHRLSVDFDKDMVITTVISVVAGTTNGIIRIKYGDTDTSIGEMDAKGIGWQIENVTLYGLVHNGSTLDKVDLSTELTTTLAYELTVVHTAGSNVEWYVNGTLAGTSTGIPSGTSNFIPFLEAINGADAANQEFYMHQIRYWIEQ